MPLMVEVVSIMRTLTVVVDEGAVKSGACAIVRVLSYIYYWI
jgi:hypothetical protein